MIFVILYFLVGLFLIFTEIFGEEKKHKQGIITGGVYGLLMGYAITNHPPSALIFGGITIGALASGKLNYMGHYIAMAIMLFIILYSGPQLVSFIPFFLVSFTSFVDRMSDAKMESIMGIEKPRPLLKVLMFAFYILDILSLKGLLAYIAFEAAYYLGGFGYEKRKGSYPSFRRTRRI